MRKTGIFIGAGPLQTQIPRLLHSGSVQVYVLRRENETWGTEKTLTPCPLLCRPSYGDPVH